jgi:hypothetical protein
MAQAQHGGSNMAHDGSSGSSMGGSDHGIDGGGGSVLDSISSSNMAPFLTKLFQIVSATATDRCITWTARGDSFVISDPDSFARDILPTYFKHNNIRSFVRQLNTYGFRKRTNISSTDEHLEFFHEKFRRDQPALLTQIKRCHQPKPQARSTQLEVASHDTSVGRVGGGGAPDMDSVKNRVGELKNRLGSLQAEIRDYNAQMEHKVNLLMQILQSSAPSPGALMQPSMLTQSRAAHSMHSSAAAPYLGAPSGLGMVHGAGAASMDLLRRDDIFKQFGGQAGSLGGLGGGMAGLGGLSSSLGLGGLAGSLGGVNAASLMGLPGMQKPGEGVAGLQHLLEAAQRTQGEEHLMPQHLLEATQRAQADDAVRNSREMSASRS